MDVLDGAAIAMADAYVEHLTNHPVPADELADFVAIASQLILLKSWRLLPGEDRRPAPWDEDEPMRTSRRRLFEYRALREPPGCSLMGHGAAGPRPRAARGRPLEAPVEPMPPFLLSQAPGSAGGPPRALPAPPEIVAREVTICDCGA